jgi:hypothetical protein
MRAFSRFLRSRSVVHLVFLALVAYSTFSILVQTSRITPDLASVNIFEEKMMEEWITSTPRRNAVPLPPVRVFREWQYYHSVEAIQRNPSGKHHQRIFLCAVASGGNESNFSLETSQKCGLGEHGRELGSGL